VRLQRLEQRAGGMTELLLDAERGLLVVGDDAGVLRLWRLGERAEILRDVEPPFTSVDSVVWLADRSGFAAAGREGLGAWSLDGAPLGCWPSLDAAPQSLAVVDQARLLVACDDSRLRLIDAAIGGVLDEVAAGERNTGIAPHPDGRRFALSACDHNGSRVQWVAVEGDALRALPGGRIDRPVDHLGAPAIDAGGTLLMVADHRLAVYEVTTGDRVARFDADGAAARWRLRERLQVEAFWTQAVRLGAAALACASPAGPLCVFDVLDRKAAWRRELAQPATALAADGPVLAAASLDWTISIWWP
jgi:hypothetical protein